MGVDQQRSTAANRPCVYPQSGRPGTARELVYMSGRTKFGRFLRRANSFPGYLHAVTTDDAQQIIADLMKVLSGDGASLLARPSTPRRKNVRGYQIRAAALVWRPGDGTHGADDPVQRTFSGAMTLQGQPVLRPPLPGRRADPLRPGSPRAHRPGGPGHQGEARDGLPRRRA